MISEDVIKALGGSAQTHWDAAERMREFLATTKGHRAPGNFPVLMRAHAALAAEYDQLANVCRLLATDERFRDAYAEALDRKRADGHACLECGEEADAGEFEDGWFCQPHAGAQFGPTDPQEQAAAMADDESEFLADGQRGTCAPCGQPIRYVDCPTGGWWAHEVHPADDHDAAPLTQPAADAESEAGE